jgi:hypothetical protein
MKHNSFVVPQTSGTPGWIVLTHDKNKIPVCMWITSRESLCIPCCVDERICCDTIFRAEKIGPLSFVIADIWLYNSNCVAACSTFEQRYTWTRNLLSMFHTPIEGTAKFIHKADLPKNTQLRGEEYYTSIVGSHGTYVDQPVLGEEITILKTEIQDVYRIQNKDGYIRVPDLKTSVYLRSKGSQFIMRCIAHDSESWTIVENIPELEVNASPF